MCFLKNFLFFIVFFTSFIINFDFSTQTDKSRNFDNRKYPIFSLWIFDYTIPLQKKQEMSFAEFAVLVNLFLSHKLTHFCLLHRFLDWLMSFDERIDSLLN